MTPSIQNIGGMESIILFVFVLYAIFYRKPYFLTYVVFYFFLIALNYNEKTTSQELMSYSLIFLFLSATSSIHYSMLIIGIFIATMHAYKNSETFPIPQLLGVIYAVAVYYCTEHYLTISSKHPYLDF